MVRSRRIRIQGAVLSLCASSSAVWPPVAQPSQRLKSFRHDDPDPRHSVPQDHGHPQRRHPLLLSHPWSRRPLGRCPPIFGTLSTNRFPMCHSLPPTLGTAGDSPTAHRFRPSIPTALRCPAPTRLLATSSTQARRPAAHQARQTPHPHHSDGQANPREACSASPARPRARTQRRHITGQRLRPGLP